MILELDLDNVKWTSLPDI